ncbi:thioredoxin domain-containing protein, partial [Candidatus Woesearchaeota archaeon]|nr:thioredoxin domain-containing protein [Candidatus Woesearchaeota archaeon]
MATKEEEEYIEVKTPVQEISPEKHESHDPHEHEKHVSHQAHETKHDHNPQKGDSSGIWMLVTLVMGVAFVAAVFTGGFGYGTSATSESISATAAGVKAVGFLNTNAAQFNLANLKVALLGSEQAGDFFEVKLDIGGMPYTSYVSKDGKYFFPTRFDTTQPLPTTPPQQPSSERVEMKPVDPSLPFKGSAGAPVTILEFTDFQCPVCSRFVSDVYPMLEEEFIKTGKVKFIVKNFPLDAIHPFARKSAESSHCAREQGKFWEMHDILFENQRALDVISLKGYAKQLGLDQTAFDSCLDTGKYAQAVDQEVSEALLYGFGGTPSFLVNGRKIEGLYPPSVFKQIIEEELGGTAPLP